MRRAATEEQPRLRAKYLRLEECCRNHAPERAGKVVGALLAKLAVERIITANCVVTESDERWPRGNTRALGSFHGNPARALHPASARPRLFEGADMGARARIEPQAVVFDLPAAEYHSDPCDQPSLTSSIAHALVSKSPLHAWNIHPRFGGNRSWQSREMGLGSVAHAMLLGTEHELVVIQADDWRAKIARDLRDAALAAGKVPVLQSDHDDIARAVKEIRRRLRLLKIKLCGRSEVSLFWLETADDGTVVQCRGRLDHLVLTKTRAEIFDLKSARSAHPKACSNHSFEYGYDIQQAAYRSALTQLYPQHAGREQFYFLFAELEPPYAVTTCAPAGSLRELGERRWRRAVNLWARCLKEKKWPGYAEGVVQLEAPRYALADEEELIYGSTSI